MKQYVLLLFLGLMFCFTDAQNIQVLTTKDKISLRGVSVVNDDVIWASGSSGQVARSTDGGKTFEWITVTGYGQRDFRDIEAFDANTALIMAVDTPAIILKTKDGGKTWKEVFYDDRKGMFLDAMDFTADGNGVVVGDPMNNKLFIATTQDAGNHWNVLKDENNDYNVPNGEAFFASSGTNIKFMSKNNTAFVTGGTQSNLYINHKKIPLDMLHGKESQGANSLAYDSISKKFVIVGGDFSDINGKNKNCELISFYNLAAAAPQTPPHGYKSCIAFITSKKLITCGWSGVDISIDGGLNWKLISGESYNVCAKAKKGNAVFLAGKNGKIAKLLP